MTVTYVIRGLNPVPWTPSRVTKQGTFKTGELEAYQLALKEELELQCDLTKVPHPPFAVNFRFWRVLDSGLKGTTGRKTRAHQVDATNLQKATEDAMQGIVFSNDREVRLISSEIVQQDQFVEPAILITISHYEDEAERRLRLDQRDKELRGL